MRRDEIVEGSLQVTAALRSSGIAEALRSIIGPIGEKPQLQDKALAAFKRYLLAAQSYNKAAKFAAKVFGLTELEDPGWLTGAESSRTLIRSVRFAIEFLPMLVELLRNDSAQESLIEQGETRARTPLTVVLPEGPRDYSTPRRVAETLLSVTALYEAVALLEGQPENTLSVLACDSGSDKSFDLLGVAKIIATVKEILISVWDRVVFYREKQVAQRLELVAESLPILENVRILEQQNAIEPEQAEIVRRKIIHGVGQFLSCGAVIPEMTAQSRFDPRELMAPEPKLLTSGRSSEEEEPESITEDEIRQLDELQRKAGRHKRKP